MSSNQIVYPNIYNTYMCNAYMYNITIGIAQLKVFGYAVNDGNNRK